jgi:Holliday junction resolvase
MGPAIAENNYGAAAIVAAKLAHLPWAFFPTELLHRIKANE